MAKKKQTKKHKFKYVAPTGESNVIDGQSPATPSANVMQSSVRQEPKEAIASPGFEYVARDMRRVGVLALSLVIIEVILWYTFNHSGLGNSVYGLIKT